MTYLEFGCLPTMIGSLPHTEPDAACSLVSRYLKEIPAWPQLPKRVFRENMVAQFSEGFPGIVIKEDKIYTDRSRDWDGPLAELYTAYLDGNTDKYALSPDYAAGFYCFEKQERLPPLAVKGQVTGPISFGLALADDSGRAIIYDDMLGDAAAKLLRLKAKWQEKRLRKFCKNTIIFVDEPAMASYGSSYVSLSRERVISLLEEVFGGISGLKGVHCCGNTDWTVLLKTSTDIISFDTYNYADSLTLYPDEVREFLNRKGTIAWGIVPTGEKELAEETVSSLKDRLEEAMAPFVRKGVPFGQIIRQGLLTPGCGLALISTDAADHALKLVAELSMKMRKRYL